MAIYGYLDLFMPQVMQCIPWKIAAYMEKAWVPTEDVKQTAEPNQGFGKLGSRLRLPKHSSNTSVQECC